jgi:hypothetical protein
VKAARAGVAAVVALSLSSLAAAQNGASWASGDSAVTTLMIGGYNDPPPPPQPYAPAEMAQLFKQVCLDTAGDPAAISAAVASGSLKLESVPVMLAAGKKSPAVAIPMWRGPGLVAAHTAGFASVREAQCNITFYPSALPDRSALAEAVSAAVGSAPVNAAEAIKKNGKPDKYYSPRWSFASGADAFRVNAIVMKGNRYLPGDRVLIALRPEAKRP